MRRVFSYFLLMAVAIVLGGGFCGAQEPLKKPEKRVEQKQSTSKATKKTSKTGSKLGNQSEKKITGVVNGHEWVDLGLPSGVKWATCNVGATSPEGCGDYFAWGETVGKDIYSESNNVTYGKDEAWLRSNGYIDAEGNLTAAFDAARQNWGGTWRMPTEKEIEELMIYTTPQCVTQNGMDGMLFKSKKNGASIFLPASGWYDLLEDEHGKCIGFGGDGAYWSSTFDGEDRGSAYRIFFIAFNFYWYSYSRYCGHSVRAVTE